MSDGGGSGPLDAVKRGVGVLKDVNRVVEPFPLDAYEPGVEFGEIDLVDQYAPGPVPQSTTSGEYKSTVRDVHTALAAARTRSLVDDTLGDRAPDAIRPELDEFELLARLQSATRLVHGLQELGDQQREAGGRVAAKLDVDPDWETSVTVDDNERFASADEAVSTATRRADEFVDSEGAVDYDAVVDTFEDVADRIDDLTRARMTDQVTLNELRFATLAADVREERAEKAEALAELASEREAEPAAGRDAGAAGTADGGREEPDERVFPDPDDVEGEAVDEDERTAGDDRDPF